MHGAKARPREGEDAIRLRNDDWAMHHRIFERELATLLSEIPYNLSGFRILV